MPARAWQGHLLPRPQVYAGQGTGSTRSVMAGLVPAIHVLMRGKKIVDARDNPGHDDLLNTQMDCPRRERGEAKSYAPIRRNASATVTIGMLRFPAASSA